MIYRFGEYELDTQTFELREGGAARPLERQVFDVLAYLVQHHDRLVTKEELLDAVWHDRFVSDAALNSRLMAARKAIGDSGREQRLIKTMHGRGYRFVGPLEQEQEVVVAEIPREAAPAAPAASRREQQIRFCMTPDNVTIAYATVGDGPPLVKAANWLTHLEFDWRSPIWRHWLQELSRDHMLVRYDERGCGLSDQNPEDFSFEGWVRDLETVVDTLGLERFPLLGISQGGPVAITYAVRHPERVSQLILYGTYAQGRGKRGLPQDELDERDAMITLTRVGWGRENPVYRQLFAGSFVPGGTPEQHRWFTDLCRVSTSAENAVRFMETFDQIDVEHLLPQLKVPTLVLHVRNDQRCSYEWGRKLAARIPGARFVLMEGQNHVILEDEPAWPHFLREVRGFLGVDTAERSAEDEGVHTILFTDVEGSTELTRRLGDRAARGLMREHEGIVRDALKAHGGLEVKSTGDGFMVSFASAARALECAIAIQRALASREGEEFRVRIGLNAGEPIAEGGDLFGSAVNLAARIADAAGGGEVLVSDVVRQLVSGKGFKFADRGEFAIKGFQERVRLHQVDWRE